MPVGILLGDTTGEGNVTATDISQTKTLSGNSVERDNFRNDVTVNGVINTSDIGIIKPQSGTSLSPIAPPKGDAKPTRAER